MRKDGLVNFGEIYFIREKDRVDGQHSLYVKIGLVKSTDRNSEERLRDHQTGNPRDLVLHHVVKTPSPYWVERGLHQRLGRNRVRGEWFALEMEELLESIALAESLAAESIVYSDIIERADALMRVPSTDVILPANPEAVDWLYRASTAHACIKVCKDLNDLYKTVFTSLSKDEQEAAEEEELVHMEHYADSRFDRQGFLATYPDLFARFATTTQLVTGTFRPAYSDHSILEIDRDLAEFSESFKRACESVNEKTMSFSDLSDLARDLEGRQNAHEWDKTIADANLRVLCGDAAEISGVCKWKRTVKEKVDLDEDGLRSAHPNEYENFLTVKMLVRQKTKKRPKAKPTT